MCCSIREVDPVKRLQRMHHKTVIAHMQLITKLMYQVAVLFYILLLQEKLRNFKKPTLKNLWQ